MKHITPYVSSIPSYHSLDALHLFQRNEGPPLPLSINWVHDHLLLSYFVFRMEMEDLEWRFLLFQLSESNQSFSLEEKVEKREIHQLQGEGGAEVDGVQ